MASASSQNDAGEFQDDARVITLPTPVGSNCSLFDCEQDPRDLPRLSAIDDKAEISLSIEIQADGSWAETCDNGICIIQDDIPGFHALSEDGRMTAFGRRKLFLEALHDSAAERCCQVQRAFGPAGRRPTKLKDVYAAVQESYDMLGINSRLRMFAGAMDLDLTDLTESEYVSLAATHLFYAFAGGKYWLIHKNGPMDSPLAVSLFGQEVWWVMHLVCPALDTLYRKTIAKMIRPAQHHVSAFRHKTGESFATDFWLAWIYSFEALKASVERFVYTRGGIGGVPAPPGSVELGDTCRATLLRRDIDPRGPVSPEVEAEFIGKTASFFLSGFSPDGPQQNNTDPFVLGLDPLTMAFIAIARDISRYQDKIAGHSNDQDAGRNDQDGGRNDQDGGRDDQDDAQNVATD